MLLRENGDLKWKPGNPGNPVEQAVESYKLADSESARYRAIYLQESSFGRIWQHVKDPAMSIAMLSVFRNERPLKANQELTAKLRQQIREAGFGYVPLVGHYQETSKETGETIPVEEESFAIFSKDGEKLKRFIQDRMAEYGQESVFFKPDGETVDGYLLFSSGETQKLGPFHPDKIGYYYSELRKGAHKGRPFTFECYEHRSGQTIGIIKKILSESGYQV